MRPTKRFGRRDDGEQPAEVPPRSFGKSRYTTAAPMTRDTGSSDSRSIEVSVDDLTLVVKDETHAWSKYDTRPGLGYGEAPDDDLGPEPEEQVAPTVARDDLDDDPIPEWGPWRSTVSEEGSIYRRSETRR